MCSFLPQGGFGARKKLAKNNLYKCGRGDLLDDIGF